MSALERAMYSVGGIRLPQPFKIRRLGHFGLDVDSMEECLHFYCDLLGFRVSDVNDFASRPQNAELLRDVPSKGYFTHYGTDHHALVLFPKLARQMMAESRGEKMMSDINQITWQVGSLKEIVEGISYFHDHEIPVVRSGRDMPGSNWHAYVPDPEGHTNELYYGIEQIGWTGHSKPREMYDRKFEEPPVLPQIPESEELSEAIVRGTNILAGNVSRDALDPIFDVEGIKLPRPFKITKIGPVNLFVDDIEASLRFYTDRMGFVITESTECLGYECTFLRAGVEHHSLGLFPKPLREALDLNPETGLASFGIEVGSYEQLRNAVSFLRDSGVELLDLPSSLHPGIDYVAYAADPEGHLVALYYYMEQVGWQGTPRKRESDTLPMAEWPQVLDALSDTYADQTFPGPIG